MQVWGFLVWVFGFVGFGFSLGFQGFRCLGFGGFMGLGVLYLEYVGFGVWQFVVWWFWISWFGFGV